MEGEESSSVTLVTRNPPQALLTRLVPMQRMAEICVNGCSSEDLMVGSSL